MSPELIGILTVGVALGGILGSMIMAIRRDVIGLIERLARIDSAIEGVLSSRSGPPSA
ncbi:MAG: hypothetical protein OXG65_15735 [Chloroflexi bacterium]|nr:hypothetical protein [Chloroflexota bacterium]